MFSEATMSSALRNVSRSEHLMTEMGEQTRQHVSRVRVIFYEQDPQWLCRMFFWSPRILTSLFASPSATVSRVTLNVAPKLRPRLLTSIVPW